MLDETLELLEEVIFQSLTGSASHLDKEIADQYDLVIMFQSLTGSTSLPLPSLSVNAESYGQCV